MTTGTIADMKRQVEVQTSTTVSQNGLILVKDEEREGLLGMTSPLWQSLTAFFRREWFSRTWIVQEVVLSRQATVICGDKAFPWEDLVLAAFCLHNVLLPVSPMTHYDTPIWIDRYRDDERKQSGFDLKDLLVFRNTALSILHGENGLDLLSAVSHPKAIGNLPSWVPDWTPRLPSFHLLSKEKWYRASAEKPEHTSLRVSVDHPAITLAGVLFGTIQKTSTYMPHREDVANGKGLSTLQRRAEVFAQWKTFALGSSMKVNNILAYGQSREEPFWRTLVVDNDETLSQPARVSFKFEYEHFYDKLNVAKRCLFNDSVVGFDNPSQYSGNLAMVFGLQDPGFKRFYTAASFNIGHRLATIQPWGWFGTVPEMSQAKDCICVFQGGDVPYVLKRTSLDQFTLVGPCFVHGLMDGKLFKEAQASSRVQDITLV
ncbi:MAG: hypothetical protein Q9167_000951 [Letrouitia subvulpina]